MNIISENPYRIAGILSNVTEKELQKQKSKIKRYSEVGKQITSDYDFDFLKNISRTEESIDKAFSDIEQNQDKVRKSLFWFINISPFDETALNYLKNNDLNKAKEIWRKVTIGKELSPKNFSCFSNLSTLNLLSTDQKALKEAIESKIQFIQSDYFKDFAHTISDETFTVDQQRQIEFFIDDILSEINITKRFDISSLFDGLNGNSQKYLSQQFTEEPIHNIENAIESTKSKRKSNQSKAYELGSTLFKNTKEDLASLKNTLGENDLKFKMLSDILANEIMQCGIDYFKSEKDKKDPTIECLELLNFSESIAIGQKVKDRVISNKEGINEFKNRDIEEAIHLLDNVADLHKNLRTDQKIDSYKITKLLKDNLTSQLMTKVINSNKETVKRFYVKLISLQLWIPNNSFLKKVERLFFEALKDNHPAKADIQKIKDLRLKQKTEEKAARNKKILIIIGVIALALLIIFGIWGMDGLETVGTITFIIAFFGIVGYLRQ